MLQFTVGRNLIIPKILILIFETLRKRPNEMNEVNEMRLEQFSYKNIKKKIATHKEFQKININIFGMLII